MNTEAKTKFFDGIASKWDEWEDMETVVRKLSCGLDGLGVNANETIVDVGCGTGNLTLALLGKLSPTGRVVAIDISPEMIHRARQKVSDPRVDWHMGDALRMPLGEASVDRIVCFSVWPHFDDPVAAAQEFKRILRRTGSLHVWHLSSRAIINKIHASAGAAVAGDVLLPASQTAKMLEQCGFEPYEVIDDDERYLVSARRSARIR